jgi:DNA-binding HxlR family transcriptional regulator
LIDRSSTPRAPGGSAVDTAPVCPRFHAAVELIGRRWTGAILFALTGGPHYFRELAAAVPGLSDRLLSTRLRELEAEGLVERRVHEGPPARVSYELTALGRGLEPAIHELHDWAQRWEHGRPEVNGSRPGR